MDYSAMAYVVEHAGQHAVTFTVNGVSRNTWTDWGLIPSSRSSEPVSPVWSKVVEVNGTNGQADLVRKYPNSGYMNNYTQLKNAVTSDGRDSILSKSEYDLFQSASGSMSFVIADQNESFYSKQQKIMNFLHGNVATIRFADDPSKTYTALITVESFSSGEHFSSLSIGYSVISES